MIEKILDRYYYEKLKLEIETFLEENYIDFKFTEDLIEHRYKKNEDIVSLEIKLIEYNDKLYKSILKFSKSRSVVYLSNLGLFRKTIQNGIKNYLKEEKEKKLC